LTYGRETKIPAGVFLFPKMKLMMPESEELAKVIILTVIARKQMR